MVLNIMSKDDDVDEVYIMPSTLFSVVYLSEQSHF